MWLFLLVALAEARSTGVYIASEVSKGCDFEDPGYTSQWGCQTSTWNYTTDTPPARQYCQDANFNNAKFMWWTGAPRNNNNFTMRAGNGDIAFDLKSYVPGRYVSIYIRAKVFDNTYKGLLLYAKNKNNTKVGDWIVPWEASPQFAAAPNASIMCNRSVMHINAEEKPYVSKFIFVAPPAGTGPITFKCMLKTGPPNPTDFGAFERVADLTLQEAPVPVDTKKWMVLPAGQSCADYCMNANNGSDPCSDAALSSSIQGLQPNPLDTIYPCHGAVFHDCTGNPRVALPEGFCTYHPASCPTGASCSMVATAATPLFCVCGAAPVNGISASVRSAPGFLAAVFSALFVGMWSSSKSHMALATMLLMASALPFAQAHNWLEGTRGRASNLGANQFCSPNFPQVNRNTIHMQVGAGQNFVVEWASAHGDFTYYVLIHDDARANASKLTRTFMDSYLNACPSTYFNGGWANNSAQPLRMKYHRFRPDFLLNNTKLVQEQVPTAPLYNNTFEPNFITSGAVWDAFSPSGGRSTSFYRSTGSLGLNAQVNAGGCAPGMCNPNFTIGSAPSGSLAQYKPAFMATDRSCTYTNASNPWVIAIYRFSHQEVSATIATALLQFPSTVPAGRYQVHYKWASYCDVMDVDVKASPTVVAAPYGTPINATNVTYDIAHHCLFEKPRNVGDCYEVVTNPQQCQAICSANTNCKAFQLLPLQMDNTKGTSLGMFPEQSYVPWTNQGRYHVNNSFCDKSRFVNAHPDSYVCYPILNFQDDFNSARPLWTLYDDADHQGFYGTCYIKARSVTFLPFTPVAEDSLDTFRFGAKCIPCDNIGQDLTNPRWGPQLDYCTDCKKATGVVPRKVASAPTWTKRATGSFTDPVKWLNPAGSPFAMADECALIASRDASCSKFVMYSDLRALTFSGKTATLVLNANLNNTASFRLLNQTSGWHYTPYALTSSYYRSCGCIQGNVTALPAVDSNSTANACNGVSTLTQCTVKGFEIYELA